MQKDNNNEKGIIYTMLQLLLSAVIEAREHHIIFQKTIFAPLNKDIRVNKNIKK